MTSPPTVFIASKLKISREFRVSKRPSVIGPEKMKSHEKPSPPKKELQKSTPKIAKEYIDTRWPKVVISLNVYPLDCVDIAEYV